MLEKNNVDTNLMIKVLDILPSVVIVPLIMS